MNIGIDIDGVLTDEHKWHIESASKYLKKEPINLDGFTTREIFGSTLKEEEDFWNKNIWEYAKKEKPIKNASEYIQKLHDEGNKIYIITAREFAYLDTELGNKMKCIVKQWLETNDIIYDKIFFTNLSKLEVCRKNNINIMIEDNVNNLNEISKEIKTICVDARYNKSCSSENIVRCFNWKEIYEAINIIKNTK